MDQSTTLHLSRGLAALVVVFGHVRNHMLPDYKDVVDPAAWFQVVAFVGGFGGQAVIVFFVMSGWLVGGKLARMPHVDAVAIGGYAVDRIARLWTVLLPVLLLQLVLHEGFGVGPRGGAGDFAALTLLGNLLGLQTVYFANFGGNYPLWSLANETAYYVLFPLLAIATAGSFRLAARVAAIVAALAYAALLSQPILLYFAVWLLGVAGCVVPFRRTGLIYVAAPLLIAASVWCRVNRIDSVFLADFVLAALFAVSVWSLNPARTSGWALRRVAVMLASFSFTLYVAHVPLIQVLERMGVMPASVADASRWDGFFVYLACVGVVVLAAFGLYLVAEAHTLKIRNRIKTWVGLKTEAAWQGS